MTKFLRALLPVLFWLFAWQLASMIVGHRLLLASPLDTLLRLSELIRTAAFWQSIFFTLFHILFGFSLALLHGVILGALAARFSWVHAWLAPPMAAMQSIPVASFIIVALIWIPSKRLSVLISFLISMPSIYAAVIEGLRAIDPKLIEMARVFRLSPVKRLLALEIPAVLPRLSTAARIAIGLSWKSGIAAEVIGIPSGSIGERLYKAKVYLETPDLFAWTLTIVLCSLACERLLALLFSQIDSALKGR